MITCGHYVLISDYEKIHDQLYKGRVYSTSGAKTYSKVNADDIVYFNPHGLIKIPDDTIDIIAVKYTELIIREKRPKEIEDEIKEMENHISFEGMEAKF